MNKSSTYNTVNKSSKYTYAGCDIAQAAATSDLYYQILELLSTYMKIYLGRGKGEPIYMIFIIAQQVDYWDRR